MAKPRDLYCVLCDHHQNYVPLAQTICKNCGSLWLLPHYDYPQMRREFLRGLPGRPFNIWRYHEVLPVTPPKNLTAPQVGGTPLWQSKNYAQEIGHQHLYIKDERYGPTHSFKDRQAAIRVAEMVEAGISEAVIASSGNAAIAYAAACARAGIKLWVFMSSSVPAEKLRETMMYGAEVVKVSGTFDQARKIASEFAAQRGIFVDSGAGNLASRDAMKTIAYEIVEQLGWRAPDWYIQAVSGGLGPMGVMQGFAELHHLGLIDQIPALAVIQPEGCAPMTKAFQDGKPIVAAVTPQTRVTILSTGDPGPVYSYLRQLIDQHGGIMEMVSDEETLDAICSLTKTEGLAMEPAAAVAFAGFKKLVSNGTIPKDDLVVVNCTGHTFPVEKHTLQDYFSGDHKDSDNPEIGLSEGLQAALDTLDEKTTTVLVVDDNKDAVLLIKRLLEMKKKYRVFEANDGQAGLELARRHLPDLIILDLMMPKIDGFGVLEALKDDPRTKDIPVIVVSAKDVSGEEWQRLRGQIEGIYQKGSLPPRDFVNQVVEVIEQKALEKGDV